MGGPLRVASIGAGIFAREAHAPAFKPLIEEGLVSMVACWSRGKESAAELAAIYSEFGT